MIESSNWCVSDNLEMRSNCFHLGVTDSGCMFNFFNALVLLQQFVTRATSHNIF